MAEAPDRPPDAVATEPSAMPALSTSEAYRPLSLLALAGFGIAVLYALVVVLGGAVALFNRIPWLMPVWVFLVPFAAVVLCWVARNRIHNSEGALGGVGFTTWGISLSVLVGLIYGAYYGGTRLAVCQQANECAELFLNRLKQGRVDQAFLLTVQPAGPGDDAPDLRDKLEIMHNTSSGRGMRGGGGPFTMFQRMEFVRMIQGCGADTRFEPLGVTRWDYDQGAYLVQQKYRVLTPLAEFEMYVGAVGLESKPGQPKGRRWQINVNQTGAVKDPPMKLTPHGEDWMRFMSNARGFASAWQEKLGRQLWDEAYLDTVPPADRERLRKRLQQGRLTAVLPVIGLAPLALGDAAAGPLPAGKDRLTRVLRAEDKTFWASPKDRPLIIADIRKALRPDQAQPSCRFMVQPVPMPLWRTAGGQVTFLFDMQITVKDEATPMPKYQVEGQLAVVGDEAEINVSKPAFRIEALELINARTSPQMPAGAGEPGGGAPPPMQGLPPG